eukprot:m.52755 g.52755  ORF g.52755 m.52755 type:complete len:196 (-) comp10815_c2_seq1:227-814(-)
MSRSVLIVETVIKLIGAAILLVNSSDHFFRCYCNTILSMFPISSFWEDRKDFKDKWVFAEIFSIVSICVSSYYDINHVPIVVHCVCHLVWGALLWQCGCCKSHKSVTHEHLDNNEGIILTSTSGGNDLESIDESDCRIQPQDHNSKLQRQQLQIVLQKLYHIQLQNHNSNNNSSSSKFQQQEFLLQELKNEQTRK